MSVLEQAIGWLAPPHCLVCGDEGMVLCDSCSTSEISAFGGRCWHCSALSQFGRACPGCRHTGGPRAVWISTTYEGVAQELVQAYKFGQQRAAAEPLARAMSQVLLGSYGKPAVKAQDYLVVPVPTATSRLRQRGFDHSALLAKLIARKIDGRFYLALGRLGQNRQLGTSRAQRLAQPAGQYFARQTSAVNGRNILLIDDVLTTGGTLIECARVLRAAGANHVDALVFAKKL